MMEGSDGDLPGISDLMLNSFSETTSGQESNLRMNFPFASTSVSTPMKHETDAPFKHAPTTKYTIQEKAPNISCSQFMVSPAGIAVESLEKQEKNGNGVSSSSSAVVLDSGCAYKPVAKKKKLSGDATVKDEVLSKLNSSSTDSPVKIEESIDTSGVSLAIKVPASVVTPSQDLNSKMLMYNQSSVEPYQNLRPRCFANSTPCAVQSEPNAHNTKPIYSPEKKIKDVLNPSTKGIKPSLHKIGKPAAKNKKSVSRPRKDENANNKFTKKTNTKSKTVEVQKKRFVSKRLARAKREAEFVRVQSEMSKARLEVSPEYAHQLNFLDDSIEDDEVEEPKEEQTCANCQARAIGENNESFVIDDVYIGCDVCFKWYHGMCAGIDDIERASIHHFHCMECQKTTNCGRNVYYSFVAPHRLNYEKEEEIDMPIQIGSKKWIENFSEIEHLIPLPKKDVEIVEDGLLFDDVFDRKSIWKKIYLVKNKRGLELNMPHDGFDIKDCINLIGPEQYVDTIDVYRQVSKQMRIDRFYERWCDPERPRLYNILSMEFSNTPMTDFVWPPRIVRELSWVHSFWPESTKQKKPKESPSETDTISDSTVSATMSTSSESNGMSSPARGPPPTDLRTPMSPLVNDDDVIKKPEVSMFCLLGMKGSFTDFHIDFGGSSVWYHVFKGKKIFYVAPPTPENLEAYRKHQLSDARHERWLGDDLPVGELGRVEINPGQTLLIPAGWIHAVLTPEDSIVFGGNFVHTLNIEMQMRVYDIECESFIDKKYQFPQFELTNWYAAKAVYEELKEANEDNQKCHDYLFSGAQALAKCLFIWQKRDDLAKDIRPNALEKFAPPILRALQKEINRQKSIQNKLRKRRCDGSESPEYGSRRASKPKLTLKIKKGNNCTIKSQTSTEDPQTKKKAAPAHSPPVNDASVQGPVVEHKLVGSMFSRRTSSGRVPKPSQMLREEFGDQIDRERQRIIDSGADIVPERQPLDYSEQMDAIAAAEEKEMELEERQRKNKKKGVDVKGVGKAVSNATPISKPKKPAQTAKQRLAKKLHLK